MTVYCYSFFSLPKVARHGVFSESDVTTRFCAIPLFANLFASNDGYSGDGPTRTA